MDSGHSYYILDAQFDYFGRRFATCSSDHSICIWDQQQQSPPPRSQVADDGGGGSGGGAGLNGGGSSGGIGGMVEAAEAAAATGAGGMGWYPSARILKASRSAVLKISWSYPEFGTLIAACSEDGSVTIWEEQVDVGNPDSLNPPAAEGEGAASAGGAAMAPSAAAAAASSSSSSFSLNPATGAATGMEAGSSAPDATAGAAGPGAAPPPSQQQLGTDLQQLQQQQAPPAKWICRATLRESPRAVKDVEFAPRHLGLRLAAGGADGVVRVYEAVDVMNLSHWPLQDAFEAERPPGGSGAGGGNVALSLSWNTSRFDPPTMVVGGHMVKVWQYDDASRKWEVACILSRGPDGGVGGGGIGGTIAGASGGGGSGGIGGSGGGGAGAVMGAAAAVHDVSWAPKMGRSYHAIATAGRDGRIRVYYLRYSERGQLTHVPEDTREVDAQGEAWRVEWNVLGTVLASSGDDGVVKLWRKKRGGGGGGGDGHGGEEWVLSKAVSEPLGAGGGGGDGMILLEN